ncbi:MAG: CaiB/BaiF CoA transferase family protein [Paracoccaceae bacterium]
MSDANRFGALAGIRVVEFTGLGPAPLAGQLLADHGADVVVIDRKAGPANPAEINRRGKRSVVLDLKAEAGLEAAKALISKSDILIEGFRPGVMERLGLGPEACSDALIYARMTGWGQTGPLAHTAGHDLNYLALTGALHMMGAADQPPLPPLNLVADFGGGTMFLLFGILSAVIARDRTGQGQVIDAAMCEGVPAMMGLLQQWQASGQWGTTREANLLDGGAPFYRCYTCACGGFISVACLEPQFFAEFIRLSGRDSSECAAQNDQSRWPAWRADYAGMFLSKSRDAWAQIFEGSDACVSPVLTPAEAARHPHMQARGTFLQLESVQQTRPTPLLSRTCAGPARPVTGPGAQTDTILSELGVPKA